MIGRARGHLDENIVAKTWQLVWIGKWTGVDGNGGRGRVGAGRRVSARSSNRRVPGGLQQQGRREPGPLVPPPTLHGLIRRLCTTLRTRAPQNKSIRSTQKRCAPGPEFRAARGPASVFPAGFVQSRAPTSVYARH